jgi:hypothetical protein
MYYDYIQGMILNDVAQYVPLNDLIKNIKSVKKGTILNFSDSQKQKKHLEYFLNYGNQIDLLKILEL